METSITLAFMLVVNCSCFKVELRGNLIIISPTVLRCEFNLDYFNFSATAAATAYRRTQSNKEI